MRPGNEDSIVVGAWRRNRSMDEARHIGHSLKVPLTAAVLDGMGGHAGGGIASRFAAKNLVNNRHALTAEEIAETLGAINRGLFDLATEKPHLTGMGATVAGLTITDPKKAFWFNIGDSRVYKFNKNGLRQLSIDDSTDDPTEGSHVITQSLGGTPSYCKVTPHIGSTLIEPGDRFLLCSDGLTDLVEVSLLQQLMCLKLCGLSQRFGEAAIENGGDDNVSVIVLELM